MARKIMIAEDNEDIRTALKILLESDDCEVHEAEDGVKALEMARQIMPDLIVMDVMMPGLVGYRVCKSLKEDPATKDIKIIFLTAREALDAQKTIDRYGGDGYFQKPFDIEQLRKKINQLLGT